MGARDKLVNEVVQVKVPSLSSANRRLSLVTVDQGVSSASNLIVLIWAAHALAPIDFGRFTLVFFVYVFAQGPVRALVSWPILVHPEDADRKPQAVLGSALILALGVGGLCTIAGLALFTSGSVLGPPMLVLAVSMPLLIVEDVGRFLAFGQSRPGLALVLDLIWLVLMAAAFVVLGLAGTLELTWFLAGWAGSGAIAGVWVFAQHGIPRLRDWSLGWLRERWDFSWRSLVSNTSSSTVALVGSWLMTYVSGPIAVAAVRAALLLERPSTTVQIAAATSTAADVARDGGNRATVLRHQRRVMLIAGAVAAVNLVVLVLLPDVIGRAILGQMWPIVEPLLVIVGLRVAAMAALSGVRAVLLGRRQIRIVMVVDIVATVTTIACLVVGAALGDAEGAVWGAFAGQALAAVAWWVAFLGYLRSGEEAPGPESEDAGDVSASLPTREGDR